ncbi:MAG: deoxyribose-phosphate aldolase [Eubacteriales bacterium]|nr:deoxyribose-phosphate aldolase [Eubacteriales bacterium]
MMTSKEAAAYIDISAVKTHNTCTDIIKLVEYAKIYRFINVHVLPCWVSALAEMLRDVEGVYVGAPVGFPSGGHTTEVKVMEAEKLIQDGVEEMDIVMNIGQLKSQNHDYVKKELETIIACIQRRVLTKVIIEINTLTDEEMFKACNLVMDVGADYIKTGTGWIPGGSNIDRIKKIKHYCKDNIKVKAAGGIRTREDFSRLVDMGVERMGVNITSAVKIIESYDVF